MNIISNWAAQAVSDYRSAVAHSDNVINEIMAERAAGHPNGFRYSDHLTSAYEVAQRRIEQSKKSLRWHDKAALQEIEREEAALVVELAMGGEA